MTRWHLLKWTCFKLDLSALKMRIGTSRLRKISFLSRMQGMQGIRIYVHKAGQAYDENIGTEIPLARSGDPRYYSLANVDLALNVKKTISSKHQQCKDANYDEKLLEKTTERMMSTAGNTFIADSAFIVEYCPTFPFLCVCPSVTGVISQLFSADPVRVIHRF